MHQSRTDQTRVMKKNVGRCRQIPPVCHDSRDIGSTNDACGPIAFQASATRCVWNQLRSVLKNAAENTSQTRPSQAYNSDVHIMTHFREVRQIGRGPVNLLGPTTQTPWNWLVRDNETPPTSASTCNEPPQHLGLACPGACRQT